ncbi:hypothetical protein H920_13833 [Fukomys damarensis]|uniref:Uncharacterized protein n=1 Tax=Fukomys damarensis TaxID=885580 RepID=A0A091D1I3_FUKDA|nr:hypothetical protein H920_13833 [Fukomys damarensis]
MFRNGPNSPRSASAGFLAEKMITGSLEEGARKGDLGIEHKEIRQLRYVKRPPSIKLKGSLVFLRIKRRRGVRNAEID